ncbi:MAG TPA: hypothetical protein VGD66_12100 [Allosphingosinicella sp.]|jgi:hypothetical protein
MFKRQPRKLRAMDFPAIRSAAAALLLLAAGASAPSAGVAQTQYGQIVLHERIIVQVPARLRDAGQSPRTRVKWKEKKGPKCVPARAIAAAALVGERSVDLILRDSRRIRAKLESSCPALDYYFGFYITPNADGQVCADRDMIRSRMGGECGIDKFRTLELDRHD